MGAGGGICGRSLDRGRQHLNLLAEPNVNVFWGSQVGTRQSRLARNHRETPRENFGPLWMREAGDRPSLAWMPGIEPKSGRAPVYRARTG